jgi:hypothetical protein
MSVWFLNQFSVVTLVDMKLKVRGLEVEANRHTILVLDVRESFGP